MESFYPSPRRLDIGGIPVEIEVARLSHAVKRDLRNYFSKYGLDRDTGAFEDVDIPAGIIEDLVIRRGLKKLVISGDEVKFSGPSPVDSFPDDVGMGDGEDDVDLYEEVLKTIVDRNRWLARRYPFGLVFAQYLSLVQEDENTTSQKDTDPTQHQPGEGSPTPTVTRLNTTSGS